MFSARRDVPSFLQGSFGLSTFPGLRTAALLWSCQLHSTNAMRGLSVTSWEGHETTEMLQIADTVKRLWFIGLLFLQKRHECLILSSVSHYANWEGDRWFKRWGIEVFNLQVSISGSAWVRAIVKPCCLASSPVSFVFFIRVTGLAQLINMQLSNFSNDKSQRQYEIYFFKNKDTYLSWQQCKTGTAGSLCSCCLLRTRVCYPELLGWNLLLISCNK